MKNYTRILQASLSMFVIMLLASCSSPKSDLTATPSDAGFVMVVDGKTLSEKGGVDDITESAFYEKMIKEIPSDEMADFKQFEYIFKDSKESGIGVNDEFMLFVKMENSQPIIGLNFKVLDRSKVDALFQKVVEKEEAEVEIVSEDGMNYIIDPDKEAVIIWNDAQLLVYAQVESPSENILATAKGLLKQSASESILSNSVYNEFYKNKKDVSVWFNYDLFLKNLAPAQQMMIASQLPFSMEGTYFYGYADFQKGKVVVEYESVLNDDMQEWMKKYQIINDDFDTDVLKMMPKTSYANMEFSISLINYYHLFVDMYKEKQVDTEMYTAQVEKEIGMTIDEVLESFSGEMAMSLHGIEMKEKTSMSYGIDEETGEFKMEEKTSMQPNPKYSAVIKFTNDKIWELMETRASELGLQKTNGYYSIPQIDLLIAYVNSTMLITNDSSLLAEVIANGSVEPNLKSTEVTSYLNKFPTYMEIDMDLDNYQDELKDMLKQEGDVLSPKLMEALNTYKRLQIMPTSTTSAVMILELKDDSKNSLEIIINNMTEAVSELSQN
ncbi:MAG: DUF4836 family protein [Bacteroidales bacterium]|nr:DUF4836 family protein [Bacteroidales bacterium]